MNARGSGEAYAWLCANVGYQGDGCLTWPFCTLPSGYGQLGHEGENYYAHRMMCTLVKGEPPTPEHEAAHSCGRGKFGCVDPRHLDWKTISENSLDCRAHGTHYRNPNGNKGRLTDDQVAGIRALKGKKTQAAIAAQFGISEPTVRDIFLGRSHKPNPKLRAFSDAEDAAVREALERGDAIAEIARRLGRTYGSVHGRLSRLDAKNAVGQTAE